MKTRAPADSLSVSERQASSSLACLKREYRFPYSKARSNDADIDTGCLVETIISLSRGKDEEWGFMALDERLVLVTEVQFPDDLLFVIAWHAKDVAALVNDVERESLLTRH